MFYAVMIQETQDFIVASIISLYDRERFWISMIKSGATKFLYREAHPGPLICPFGSKGLEREKFR